MLSGCQYILKGASCFHRDEEIVCPSILHSQFGPFAFSSHEMLVLAAMNIRANFRKSLDT